MNRWRLTSTSEPAAQARKSRDPHSMAPAVLGWTYAQSAIDVVVVVSAPNRLTYAPSFVPPGIVNSVLPLKAPSRIFLLRLTHAAAGSRASARLFTSFQGLDLDRLWNSYGRSHKQSRDECNLISMNKVCARQLDRYQDATVTRRVSKAPFDVSSPRSSTADNGWHNVLLVEYSSRLRVTGKRGQQASTLSLPAAGQKPDVREGERERARASPCSNTAAEVAGNEVEWSIKIRPDSLADRMWRNLTMQLHH